MRSGIRLLSLFFSLSCRVVFAFGERITNPVNDITVTYLRAPVIDTLRAVDARVKQVLSRWGCLLKIAERPGVLVPLHFERDAAHMAAASPMFRSVVWRPCVTAEFMT